MRAVVQRVTSALVRVGGQTVGEIGPGLAVLAGVARGDQAADVQWMARKILQLRVFADAAGRMNHSVADRGGGLLVISQFTLLGDVRKGNRPAFDDAEDPVLAAPLFDLLLSELASSGLTVATGQFRTHMEVQLVNDGPVTILLDSRKLF
jgi:D-tyrosyl-tRNA(Tyr) deacylase